MLLSSQQSARQVIGDKRYTGSLMIISTTVEL